MFYIKKKNKKVPVEDPIYTTCPMCGCEHEIDLADILTTGGDLYGTQVYCHRCSFERAKHHRGEPWADQILGEGV